LSSVSGCAAVVDDCESAIPVGTIDGASVYPREVIKEALAHNAAAVILVHNHPSGSPAPGQADRSITDRLQHALNTLGIRLLDHLIVGHEGRYSFAKAMLT
jgi:DNA repair protein RadC